MSEYTQQLLSVSDLGTMLGAKGSTIRGYLDRMGVKPAYVYGGRLYVYNLTPPEYDELKRRVEYLRRRPAGTGPRQRGNRTTPEQTTLGLPETVSQGEAPRDLTAGQLRARAQIDYIAGEVKRIGDLVDRLMSVWGLTSVTADAAADADKPGQAGH